MSETTVDLLKPGSSFGLPIVLNDSAIHLIAQVKDTKSHLCI